MVTHDAPEEDAAWLAAFHAGERQVLEACYRRHFGVVAAAAARVLRDVDAETVTHEIFYRLLSDPRMRAGFRGGNLGAWLGVVARRAAIDMLRKIRREAPPLDDEAVDVHEAEPGRAS